LAPPSHGRSRDGRSCRYYAGRLTLRWDVGDEGWFDRTVDWLAAHGHHPYFVLEPQEIDELRSRYGPRNAAARLDRTPMLVFRGGAVITTYDAVHARSANACCRSRRHARGDAET
jgi:hypothetical protein